MANVYIKTAEGGEDTSPAPAMAVALDNGTTSYWSSITNLLKELASVATSIPILLTEAMTLTNKRITKRVVTVTQAAEPAINTDNGDIFTITGLAQAITSLTTNLTGTPVDGDMIMMQITDDGTGRAITPGDSFLGTANNTLVGLTTVASKTEYLLWQYSDALSVWVLLGRDHDA